MRFGLNEEQLLLRQTVEALAAERAGSAEFRRHAVIGAEYDPALWRSIAGDLGLAGLTIPVEYGGAGAGGVELAVVAEALGRSLVPSPFFATVALGGAAIAASTDASAKGEYLPAIAAGETTATLAHFEDADSGRVAAVATEEGGAWTITGVKHAVVDGATADLIIVSALDGGTVQLFLVDASAVTRVAAVPLDSTRPIASLHFDSTPATPLAGGALALSSTLRSASLALAAESVGVAQWCLDTAVSYAQTRVQFNRPIGSFQAIKHKLADMLMDVESSRADVGYATWVEDGSMDDGGVVAALTSASVSDAAFRVASQTLQVLGGIGYTWEHDAHFYFKRAKTSALLLGSAAKHRESALAALGI